MKIIVTNRKGNRYKFNSKTDKHVKDLKSKIQEKEGTPIDQQILIYSFKQLESNCLLTDYNMLEENEILLIDAKQSLLLKSSVIFSGSTLFDRIHQSIINLKINPKQDEVINLLIEAISFLDNNLVFNLTKELFSLILSCFSLFPVQSLTIFGSYLQKSTVSVNQILIFSSVLSYLAQFHPEIPICDYNYIITEISTQIISQITKLEDQPILIFNLEVPHQFRVSLLTDIILLTTFTNWNVKIFYSYIFSHSNIPKIKKDFFISKIFKAKLITAIPETKILEKKQYLDFSFDNLSDFLSRISKQSFVKILPFINELIIKNSSTNSLPINFTTIFIRKCIEFDVKTDLFAKLVEQLQKVTKDLQLWNYIKKYDIKLTDKSIIKVFPQILSSNKICSSFLLEVTDFKIYTTVFSYKHFDCDVLSKMEFWKHIMSLVSKVDCDEDTIYQFAFQFKRKFGLIKIVDFYTHMIFDNYPPNEKQARFLVIFFDKLPIHYKWYFYDKIEKDSDFVNRLISQKAILPLSLCKLFYFKSLPSEITPTFLLEFEFSYKRNESTLINSIEILPLLNQSCNNIIDFISQKNNFNLLNRFDQNSISLIACSLFFTSNKTPINIKGLSQHNILPFLAISFNYLHECKNTNFLMNIKMEYFSMFIDSLQLLEQDKSQLLVTSVNSILSNVDYLFDKKYFSNEAAIAMIDFLCKSALNGNNYSDSKLLIFALFKLSLNKEMEVLAKEMFNNYKSDLLNFIINNSTEIINDTRFENIRLNLRFFDLNEAYNAKSDDILYQAIVFITKYCMHVHLFKVEDKEKINGIFQKKITSEKWDDALIVLQFMEKFNIKIQTDSLIDRKVRFDIREKLLSKTTFINAKDIISYILDDPMPDKHCNLFSILFNILMKNLSIATQYYGIFLDNNVSNQQLKLWSITSNLSYLYCEKADFFKISLQHLFSYSKKDLVFVRRLKTKKMGAIPLDFSFLVDLVNEKSFQSFLCLLNIASSFPFFFESNPQKVIDITFPAFDCFASIYDSEVTQDIIIQMKTACASISFLFSCLYSTNFISFFSNYLFQNINSLSDSNVFGLSSILLSLFKTPIVNIVVLSLAIKYDFFDIMRKLVSRKIQKGSFKDSYFANLYNVLIEYFFLLSKITYNDALFIEQVSKGKIQNPFFIKFNNFPTISQVQIKPLLFLLPQNKNLANQIKNFMFSINQIQSFWITFTHPAINTNKSIKNPFQALMKSTDPNKEITNELPPIPQPISIKMQRFLVSKPLWVFNWIVHDIHFPIFQDHYDHLVETITQLNKIKEDAIKKPNIENEPFKNEFNVFSYFSAHFFHKNLFESLLNKLEDDSNSALYLIQLLSLILNQNDCVDSFLSLINDQIIKIRDCSLSPKLLNNLIVFLTQYFQQNCSVKDKFFDLYLGNLMYVVFFPDFRNNKDILYSTAQLLSLFERDIPYYFTHLIGFILIENNMVICPQAVDVCVKFGENKSAFMIPMVYHSFDNLISSNFDLPFDKIKYYIDRLPSISKGCISTLDKYVSKIIEKITESDFTDKNQSDLICEIFNYFTPKAHLQKQKKLSNQSSMKFSLKLIRTQSSSLSLFRASQRLINSSPLFWENIYNEHRSFIKKLIEKDISNIDNLTFLSEYCELMPFKFRLNLFQRKVSQIRTNSNLFELKITRQNILTDTFSQLYGNFDVLLLGDLRIDFIDEGAIDAGGPKKEWLTLVVKELLKPEYALFKQNENQSYYPNKLSSINENHIYYFKMAGAIIGRALLDGVCVNAHFSMSFLRMILHQNTYFQDLENYDEELFTSLQSILNSDNPESFDLYFEIDDDVFGEFQTIELIENGSNILVTKKNVKDYVESYAEYKLKKSVINQINAFSEGFDAIIPQKCINMFTPRELDLLICGIPEINVKDLREHTHYEGIYNNNHPTIRLFFDVLECWEQDDLAKLLMFITGTSLVPLNGFSDFEERGKPIIINYVEDTKRFPAAHTCSNTLDLPVYKSEEEMNNKLYIAVQHEKYGYA